MKRQRPIAYGVLSMALAWSACAQATATPSAGHVVNPGDNLEKIARLHDCRVADLMSVNGLKADSIIFPGQKLKLPVPSTLEAPAPLSEAAATPETTPISHAGATHKVVSGDTFGAIAREYSIPLDELLAANPDIKPTALRLGQTIRLGRADTPPNPPSLDAGSTQMVIATKEISSLASPEPLVSPPAVKIQSTRIDRQMTYLEFASRQGTNTKRLNQLNGLDLLDSALLARGTELLAPVQP